MLAVGIGLLPCPVLWPNVSILVQPTLRSQRGLKTLAKVSWKTDIRQYSRSTIISDGQTWASKEEDSYAKSPFGDVATDLAKTSPTKQWERRKFTGSERVTISSRVGGKPKEGKSRPSLESRTSSSAVEEIEIRGLKDFGWRHRATTFEQLDFESDLGNEASARTQKRLVDYDFLCNDIELWETLLEFRSRVYGPTGVAEVWNHLRSIRQSRVSNLLSSYKIVKSLLDAGYEDDALLFDVCEHFSKIYKPTRNLKKPDFPVYTLVVGHVLRREPEVAHIYHSLLEHLPPSKTQIAELVLNVTAISEPTLKRKATEKLQAMYPGIKTSKGTYDYIIPSLFKHYFPEDALVWHKFLVKHEELPNHASSIEPTIAYLSQSGRRNEVQEIMRHLGGKFLPDELPPAVAAEQKKFEFAEMVSELERNSPLNRLQIPKAKFGDDLCARLLATRFFSIQTIINGLDFFQVTEVGAQSVRSILLRNVQGKICDLRQVREHFEQLSELGISTGASKFSRLVHKLVTDGNAQMLYDVAICDQHPDELENHELQERLLAQYELQGETRQVQRTLAVLLLESSDGAYETKSLNILLRSALKRGNDALFERRLGDLFERQIPVTLRSQKAIAVVLLGRRRPKRDDKRTLLPSPHNLNRYIRLMKRIVSHGTEMPPKEWNQPLTYLLHSGDHTQFENLLIFLLKWYSDPGFRSSKTSVTSWAKGSPAHLDYTWRPLISESRLHSIMQMSLYNTAINRNVNWSLTGVSFDERSQNLAKHPSLWGLRLLARLRDMNFPVSRSQVKQICIWRLWAMFSVGFRSTKRNQTIKDARVGQAREYIAAMEHIWGGDLFRRSVSVDHYASQVVYLANRIWYKQLRYMLWFMGQHGYHQFYKKSRRTIQRPTSMFTRQELLRDKTILEEVGMGLDPDPELYVPLQDFLELPAKNPGSVEARNMKILKDYLHSSEAVGEVPPVIGKAATGLVRKVRSAE